jgi:hypothetical protein
VTIIDLSTAQWRKSRFSNGQAECVEVATAWRKSSHSNGSASCVEVGQAAPARVIAIRDTTDRHGGTLAVSPAAWQAFTTAVRHGQAVHTTTPA